MVIVNNKPIDHNFLDSYSLGHFSFGVIAYYIGITLEQWFWLHLIFEIIENSITTRTIANKYLYSFGFKMVNFDTITNFLGDQTSAMTGWLIAYLIDKIIFKRNPTPLIKNTLTANKSNF